MRSRVSRVELETFCHATEDESKVIAALLNLVPEEVRKRAERRVRISSLRGHYGNPIKVIRLSISKPSDAERILAHILTSMSSDDLRYVLDTLEERVDLPHVYLRIDKQSAYLSAPRPLAGDDVIKVKVTVEGVTSNRDVREYLERLAERPRSV